MNHLQLAHQIWEKILEPGDWAIDATCGNGHDTLKLAELVSQNGEVVGLDIQEAAILSTQATLNEHFRKAHLFQVSHATFPTICLGKPIRLIVYNLGYLPGGDKSLTTRRETTLKSVQEAIELILPGGMVSITCYSGHPEGAKEEEALLMWVKALDPKRFTVSHHLWVNRHKAPSLLSIKKLF